MILRLILILLVLWAAYKIIKLVQNMNRKSVAEKTEANLMVACDYCGTHVPTKNAIRTGSGVYCSTEHLEQDQSR